MNISKARLEFLRALSKGEDDGTQFSRSDIVIMVDIIDALMLECEDA
jgi:hypothetical protein